MQDAKHVTEKKRNTWKVINLTYMLYYVRIAVTDYLVTWSG